ncbi:Sec-independent protein translocase protein TatB [Thermopetrobacter sp. TC1]|uniref:Sec-independent protein translocase protein TatB n=1 Tax=Thermopetrobacter sp. TC1 TaxID=1495045 RepID=UPI000690F4AE|nr:Sec-independent protein translocase protein TatB [Thermopetrobacter sp. TC1]
MFDFGIGATELMLIAVVALIVVGPKDLPRLMRTVGHMVNKVRSLAREFQGHLDEAMRETGLDEVKESVGKVKEYTVADLDAEFEELEKEFREKALPNRVDAKDDALSPDDDDDHDIDETGEDDEESADAQPAENPEGQGAEGASDEGREPPGVISLDAEPDASDASAAATASSAAASEGTARPKKEQADVGDDEQGRGRQGS